MSLIINFDVMLANRKVKSKALAKYLRLSQTSLSLFKSGKLKGIRSKKREMMRKYLHGKLGDSIDYTADEPAEP